MNDNTQGGGTQMSENLEEDLDLYAKMIREEVEALLEVVPDALARQWTTSPVPRPRDEEARGIVGDRHSDPTADVALDPRRMAVRASLLRSRDLMRETAVAVRGVRRAMERNIEWYDGE